MCMEMFCRVILYSTLQQPWIQAAEDLNSKLTADCSGGTHTPTHTQTLTNIQTNTHTYTHRISRLNIIILRGNGGKAHNT
ncbi:hypothetical protein EXN66_Car022381 [Channa argus]|uniref:Uncharacterized protein n=1 Tax=Channa argus TaxID=215402 RepID=A0A6G1QWJ5_CHAAH|nr:hypothetical protein EXN66_Car022381 [Channa argus]